MRNFLEMSGSRSRQETKKDKKGVLGYETVVDSDEVWC